MRVDALARRLVSDGGAVLVTVARVEGSAPRAVGASMLVTREQVVGSIGGGRLEHEALARARLVLDGRAAAPLVERHALGPGLGQCCGGVVTLWIEPLGTRTRMPPWVELLRAAALVTVIASARAEVPVGARLVLDAGRLRHTDLDSRATREIEAAARRQLERAGGRAAWARIGSDESSVLFLVEPDPDEPVTLVFGAGHVGRALVPILAGVPGRVTWIDARPDAFPPTVPVGVDCYVVPHPEDEVPDAPAGASFVVLTHDHALDLRLAEAILRRDDVGYFGLIGSVTKRERFVRRLRTRGITADRTARMHCPIGLAGVGGKTPGEIAVAIAAELLQQRGRVRDAAVEVDVDAFSAS